MTSGAPDPLFFNVLAQAIHSLSLRAVDLTAIVVATLLALAFFNRIASNFDMLDKPDGDRKTHAANTPLTGGVSLLVGVWIGALIAADRLSVDFSILALLGVVATIHAFDDQSGLSARQRLVIDAMLALSFTIITGATIESLGVLSGTPVRLGALAIPVTVFAYLALTNAFNMLDGVDGLAILQFLISIISLGLWHVAHAPNQGFDALTIAIVTASLPVLAANLGLLGAGMKCFLGDSGARFLGFFLVYALIAEGTRALSPVDGAYLVALPLLDMCAVVMERLRAGSGPMRPDRRHLHHLLLDALGSRRLAVAIMAVISLSFVVLLGVLTAAEVGDLTAAAAFLGIAGLYWRFRRPGVNLLGRFAAVRKTAHVPGPAE